jgi:hypothetical protein
LKSRYKYLLAFLALAIFLIGAGYVSSALWLSLTYGGLTSIVLSDLLFAPVRSRIIRKGPTGLYARAFISFPVVVFLASTVGSEIAKLLYDNIFSTLDYYPPVGYGTLFLGTWHIGNRYPIFSLGWLVPTVVIALLVSMLVCADLYLIQQKEGKS